MFSVVIPLYNKEQSIKNTIQSVLNQSFQDLEIIVINDGSTDNSVAVVEQFSDFRIRLIHQENQGVSAARNRGIEEAKYEWIAFLDADDLWKMTKLNILYKILSNNPNLDWIIHGYNMKRGEQKIEMRYPSTGVLIDVVKDLSNGLMIQTSAVSVKKESLNQKQITFRVGLNRSEDREVWYKLSLLYPSPYYLNEPLSDYIVDANNNSLTTDTTNISIEFISLENRLNEVLTKIKTSRKIEFLLFLNKFNKNQILKIWVKNKEWNPSFDKYFNEFELKFILVIRRFPILFKRLIRKIFF